MLEIQKEIESLLGEYDLFKNGHLQPLLTDDIPPKTIGYLLIFENDSHYLSIEDWEDGDYSIYVESKISEMVLADNLTAKSEIVSKLRKYNSLFEFSKALDYSIKQRELYIMENILPDENIINLDLNV